MLLSTFAPPAPPGHVLVDPWTWHRRAALAHVSMALLLLAAALAGGDDHREAVLFTAVVITAAGVTGLASTQLRYGRSLLIWPALTLLMLVGASVVVPVAAQLTVGFIAVAFLFVGLTQPPGTSFYLVVPALMTQWLIIDLPPGRAAIRMLIAAVVWIAVAELPARLSSDLRAARERLEREAVTDSLTGLTNRRGWTLLLNELLTVHDAGTPLALLLLDLDHFKAFNDAHGHLAGDVLLQTFAARIATLTPRGAVAARWGGEEFAIALPRTSQSEAFRLAEDIRGIVPENQTCSVGLTMAQPGDEEDTLLARADAVLYVAKHKGRDRIEAA